MKLSRVGVDLAKNVYQLHGVDRHGKTVWKRRLRRGQWLQALMDKAEPGCEIGTEACTGAHHWARLLALERRFNELDKQIEKLARRFEVTRRLQQLRGVGPRVATALVATVGDGQQYTKGRQMASALGLTPIQNSSGDRFRLFGISKRGDVYLRTQMIHGARAVISQAKHRDDPLSRWVTNIAKRRHPNVAAVALANKTARMAWAMLQNDTDYELSLATS